jgi:PadR family transcriptional regulator, regulatory protein PadR
LVQVAPKIDLGLTRLETVLLSALVSKDRYGLEIRDTVKKVTGGRQSLSFGGLYAALARLERRGFVTSEWGESTPERQGARRRYYHITGDGARALADTRDVLGRAFRLAPTASALVAEGA